MYNISEAAKETGLSKHTLRYYEKIELLAITKDEKGHRIYKQADLGALTFIKCLTKTGMALDQIKEMSRLALVKPEENAERILYLLQMHVCIDIFINIDVNIFRYISKSFFRDRDIQTSCSIKSYQMIDMSRPFISCHVTSLHDTANRFIVDA